MLYHLPILSRPDFGLLRAPGAGLGNLLFPIARAVIAQSHHGGTLVIPTMRQIKIGTFLRRERDKRTYGDIFHHRDIGELKDWGRAHLASAVKEGGDAVNASGTVEYEGLGRQFHDLEGHSALIKSFLLQRARIPNVCEPYDIAMHVRLGDFGAADANATRQNTSIPLEWYRKAIAVAREQLGRETVRGVLFTDADPIELISELGLDGFEPEPQGNALSSILALAQSHILIGSRSTFSLWGRYLGAKKAIWPEGFEFERYAPLDKARDIFI